MESNPNKKFNINEKIHKEIWEQILEIRKLMSEENLSFNEAKDRCPSFSLCTKENIENLSVYYSFFIILFLKEQFETEIAFSKFYQNPEYLQLKEKFSINKNNISFLSSFRNIFAHARFDSSLDGKQILFEDNKKHAKDVELSKREVNKYAYRMLLSLLKTNKMYNKNQNVEELKNKTLTSNDSNLKNNENFDEKTSIIFNFYKLNMNIVKFPDMKFNDIVLMMQKYNEKFLYKNYMENSFEILKNPIFFKNFDAILYATYVIVSDYGSKYLIKYSDNPTEKSLFVKNLRNSLVHGHYIFKEDGKIRFDQFTAAAEKDFRKYRKKIKKSQEKYNNDERVQEFIREIRPKKFDTEEFCTMSREQLLSVCNEIITEIGHDNNLDDIENNEN